MIGFNEFVQQKVRKTRESKFSQFKAFLEELAVEGELDVVSKNMSKINAYLKQKKLKRYYCVSLQQKDDSDQFCLVLDEKSDIIEEEKLIDGHFFIQTEVKEQTLTGKEVISSYKSLQKVERIFKVLKKQY